MAVFDTGGNYRHHHPDKNQTTKIRLVPKGIGLFFVNNEILKRVSVIESGRWYVKIIVLATDFVHIFL